MYVGRPFQLQACDIFKEWWLMMVQQSGESLGGGVWTTPVHIRWDVHYQPQLVWFGQIPELSTVSYTFDWGTGDLKPTTTNMWVGGSQVAMATQNLLKIHAKVQLWGFRPWKLRIFRFRLRLASFRGYTFVDGPLVHLSLNELSSVLLSPKSGEEHTHF